MAQGKLVIYCTHCPMWFDTKNGWKANRMFTGIPACPACGAPLTQIESEKFYEANRKQGRMDEVKTWEWPYGSHWASKEARS